ncbi:IS110 family transposase [Marinilabiliaceae bacterium JC017]|nr:IS110 family transposase [Marinilabiliaceae bacterium JC017]
MAKIINPNAAGIDISAKEHYVAVSEEICKEDVRCFKSFTRDLHELANWLKECKVETIAMESTGVYWYHLYTILLDYGFEVYLVNAYHVKNVPGRKSDVRDARWLQQLHSYGLLNSCFQPDNLTRSLRNYVRQRKSIVKQMATEIQRMQKALEQMNIKLNNVIRDITGKTGMQIITKILEGERDPKILAQFRDRRIKASRELLIKSLEGNWRQEQLFNLELAFEHYHFLQNQLLKCDEKSEDIVDQMSDDSIDKKKLPPVRKQKNQPNFNVAQYLYHILGVDVTEIYGLKATTALTIFSETGPSLKEKFPSVKQFLSWLNVVPDNKITGGKVISSRVKKKKNRAGQAFRDAANALWNSQTPLGDYLRSKKAKKGARQAIVATARRIASIYYTMVTERVNFDSHYLEKYTLEYLKNKLIHLEQAVSKTKVLIFGNETLCKLVI